MKINWAAITKDELKLFEINLDKALCSDHFHLMKDECLVDKALYCGKDILKILIQFKQLPSGLIFLLYGKAKSPIFTMHLRERSIAFSAAEEIRFAY